MKNKRIFIIIGIFWLVVLLGFIGFKEYTLKFGKEIMLKTVPVDPRDLFRGDYVTLRYDISMIDKKLLTEDVSNFKENDQIYVSLETDNDNVARVVEINKQRPQNGKYIKGTIKYIGNDKINVEYGLESYFVPEGKGNIRGGNNLYAKVILDSSGNSVLKSLVLNGEELRFDK